jgi:1,4-dihydroxy-2-naphthoate octaprenyltransferase
MRDIANDKAVGKNTLVVKLGSKNAKIYHGIIFVIAYLSWFIYAWIYLKSFILLAAIVPVGILHSVHLIKVYRICDPKDFDPELKKIALSALLMAVILWVVTLIPFNS